MFRRFPKITRFLIYYFSCLLLIYLIDVLFDQTFLQVFNLNKHLTSDIHLNDIYYRKHSTSGDSYMEDEKKVILVNIQEIPFSVEGREMYVKLLNKLKVESFVKRTRKSVCNEKNRYCIEIMIKSNEQFRNNIGFRHCIQKSLRLEIACVYENFCEQVKQQHNKIIN